MPTIAWKNKKAIIFDNDGVFVDTETVFYEACRNMCNLKGFVLDHATFVDAQIISGRGLWSHLGVEKNSKAEISLRHWRHEEYSKLLLRAGSSMNIPGVSDILAKLNERFRLCVVTSSSRHHFDLVHRYNEFVRLFEFVISRDDIISANMNMKPSKDPYCLALSRLQLVPSECVVIEDSQRGLDAAVDANIDCVIVESAWSGYQNYSRASCVISSLSKLFSLFAGEF